MISDKIFEILIWKITFANTIYKKLLFNVAFVYLKSTLNVKICAYLHENFHIQIRWCRIRLRRTFVALLPQSLNQKQIDTIVGLHTT